MSTYKMELWETVCQLSDHTIFGDRTLKGYSPMVPGHEFVGDVVAVGPGEQVWKIGDRAGGGWHGGHDRMTTTNSLRNHYNIAHQKYPRDVQFLPARALPDV